MSPKNKIKLNLLRKKLDKIDNQLLKVVKKRTEIVKKVLSLKTYKKEIIDKKRISEVLKKIKKESLKLDELSNNSISVDNSNIKNKLKKIISLVKEIKKLK